jgi:plasmid stability protein
MALKEVKLHFPLSLYERFRVRAQNNHRTVEAEVLEVVTKALPVEDNQPDQLDEELDSLVFLDDDNLWRAARSHMPKKAANQMAQLNYKQQSKGLTETELATLNQLGEEYDRYMLIRAQAMVLLKERRHDISEFKSYE